VVPGVTQVGQPVALVVVQQAQQVALEVPAAVSVVLQLPWVALVVVKSAEQVVLMVAAAVLVVLQLPRVALVVVQSAQQVVLVVAAAVLVVLQLPWVALVFVQSAQQVVLVVAAVSPNRLLVFDAFECQNLHRKFLFLNFLPQMKIRFLQFESSLTRVEPQPNELGLDARQIWQF